jgi:hypothetical protein
MRHGSRHQYVQLTLGLRIQRSIPLVLQLCILWLLDSFHTAFLVACIYILGVVSGDDVLTMTEGAPWYALGILQHPDRLIKLGRSLAWCTSRYVTYFVWSI